MAIELQVADGVAAAVVHAAFEEFAAGPVNGLDALLQQVRDIVPDEQLQRDVCLRVCDSAESQNLNQTYRGGNAPTNILSFTAAGMDNVTLPLGDLALCWPVAVAEAQQQGKTVAHHVAHLCVHGVLHLLGYDHVDEAEAQTMERVEIQILANLGVADPYK